MVWLANNYISLYDTTRQHEIESKCRRYSVIYRCRAWDWKEEEEEVESWSLFGKLLSLVRLLSAFIHISHLFAYRRNVRLPFIRIQLITYIFIWYLLPTWENNKKVKCWKVVNSSTIKFHTGTRTSHMNVISDRSRVEKNVEFPKNFSFSCSPFVMLLMFIVVHFYDVFFFFERKAARLDSTPAPVNSSVLRWKKEKYANKRNVYKVRGLKIFISSQNSQKLEALGLNMEFSCIAFIAFRCHFIDFTRRQTVGDRNLTQKFNPRCNKIQETSRNLKVFLSSLKEFPLSRRLKLHRRDVWWNFSEVIELEWWKSTSLNFIRSLFSHCNIIIFRVRWDWKHRKLLVFFEADFFKSDWRLQNI